MAVLDLSGGKVLNRIRVVKKISSSLFSLVPLLFFSCQLFENDVADFMEKYTETAAIEEHTISVETYNDSSNQLCIASDSDTEISFYMRNPKKFSLIPSVDFNNLNTQFSRTAVDIEQPEFAIIKLSLPQEFLIPVDEGQDISAQINLKEPMSGRDFDRYTVNLHCNSKPPLILNPTVMNKNNQVFVVAFDMPNEEEVAVRHKDLAEVEINGKSYPVSVTTSEPAIIDPETPDLKIAHYTFTDSHFKRTNPGYSVLGGKTFAHNTNNSVYFETDDPFVNGDKEYTIILRDSAGLTSEVKASTSISKLKKPVIKDQNGFEISEYDITQGGYSGIPYNEDTERGVITIYPPTEDHLNQPVSGATVHYKVYEATGRGRIYTSGTTTSAKTIELPQNTYRVEAYATLTNYENSATTTVKFRFMNNVLYVRPCTDSAGFIGDGSATAPYATFDEAIADINDEENRPDIADKFTIYIEGDFTQPSVYAYLEDDDSDPDTAPVKRVDSATIHGDIKLYGTIRTNELVIKKNPVASTGKLKSITLTDTNLSGNSDPLSITKVTIGDVTITNNESNKAGILQNAENTLIIDGTIITGCNTGDGSSAIVQNTGSLLIKNCNISNNNAGLRVNEGSSCDIQGGLFESNSLVAVYLAGSGAYSISGGTFKNNSSSSISQTAIWLALTDTATCTITGGSITQNNKCGIIAHSGILKLYGGEITNNLDCGIQVDASATLKVKGKPVVKNNTKDSEGNTITANIQINTAGKTITIDGPLTTGASIGITTAATNEPAAIGAAYTFANGYTNSGSPAQYFTSDRGFSIVAGSGGAVNIAKTGSNGSQYLSTDYNFVLTANSNLAVANQSQTITITPVITRTEPSDPATPLWLGSDNKLYLASDHSISAGSDTAVVTWSIKIKNGGQLVATLTPNSPATANAISVDFPALLEGNYTLQVIATYMGEPHEALFEINVITPFNDEVITLSAGTNGTAGTSANYVYFGAWPQTIKAANVEINELESIQQGNFTYYHGNDGNFYVKCLEDAYEAGKTYSNGTEIHQSSANSYKYFKVEPIKWRVLTTDDTGKKLLFAENLLNAGMSAGGIPDYYADVFINTAFTSTAQSKIAETALTDMNNSSGTYKVFMPSKSELDNSTYFTADTRKRISTDFAKANSVDTSYDTGPYWTRTRPSGNYVCQYDGTTGASWTWTNNPKRVGMVPMMWINP